MSIAELIGELVWLKKKDWPVGVSTSIGAKFVEFDNIASVMIVSVYDAERAGVLIMTKDGLIFEKVIHSNFFKFVPVNNQ